MCSSSRCYQALATIECIKVTNSRTMEGRNGEGTRELYILALCFLRLILLSLLIFFIPFSSSKCLECTALFSPPVGTDAAYLLLIVHAVILSCTPHCHSCPVMLLPLILLQCCFSPLHSLLLLLVLSYLMLYLQELMSS